MVETIVKLFNKILLEERTPNEWKRANIIPIPKTSDWEKNIDKTRPITLMETLRKIFSKAMTNRVEKICRTQNILRGNNCSVLKGTSTHSPITVIRNIMEDANQFRTTDLWIVLQDMRKAYDSVGWTPMEAALRRIKMNQGYINILKDLHCNRTSSIITAHGFTDPYTVQDGLDQGETHSPILWRIFYDPLLCAIGQLQNTKYKMQPVSGETSPAINHLAFVDDTVWISNSREGITQILNKAESFFKRNDIEINTDKTVVIRMERKRPQEMMLSADTDESLSQIPFCGKVLNISKNNIAHRYLGVWISGDNSPKHTTRKITTEITAIINKLSKKPLSEKIINYVTRAVMLPIIEYRTKGIMLLRTECATLTGKMKKLFRQKANLSRETCCKTYSHPDFYDVPTVEDIQDRARISELINDLNSPLIEGAFTRHRLAQFQFHRWTRTNPLANPQSCKRDFKRFPLLAHLMNRLTALNCQVFDAESSLWKRPTPQTEFLDQIPTLEDVLEPYHKYHTAAPLLRKINCISVNQILDNNHKLLGYGDIKKAANLNPRGRLPRWYKFLQQRFHANPVYPFTMAESSNNHTRKWKTSTERFNELISVDHRIEYFNNLGNLFLEIDPDKTQEWKTIRQDFDNHQRTEFTFYTDGSLRKEPAGENTLIRMGAAWINQETGHTFRHNIQSGNASSTNAEVIAVLSVFEVCPSGSKIHLFTDSQAVVFGLNAIISGKYWDSPISHIIKKPEWTSWEVIALTFSLKKLKCKVTKVEAHTGDTYNEEADRLAKEASYQNLGGKPVYVHHNISESRTGFQLAINHTAVTGNIRKHIKHINQNFHRGSWFNHWTADRLKSEAEKSDIDWKATKAILEVDGKTKSGFTSMRTSMFKTYITKLLTGTLPTADVLYKKWSIYQDDLCPRCRELPETNDHIWNCRRATRSINTIVTDF